MRIKVFMREFRRYRWLFFFATLLIFPYLTNIAQDEPIFNMMPSAGTTTIVRAGNVFDISVDFYLEGLEVNVGEVACDLWWGSTVEVTEDNWTATPMTTVILAPDGESEHHSLSLDTSDLTHGYYGFTTRCAYDNTIYWYRDFHEIADGILLIESPIAPISNILRMRPQAGSINVFLPEEATLQTFSVDFYIVGVTDSEGQAVGVTCDVWTDLADGVADDNWGAIPMVYTRDAVAGLVDRYEVEIDISGLAEDDYGFTTRCDYEGQTYWFNEQNPSAGGDGILLISSLNPETVLRDYHPPITGIDWVGGLFPFGGFAQIYNVGDDRSRSYSIQVYEKGITEAEGQGENIECFLSWGLFNSEPIETSMSYDSDVGQSDKYRTMINVGELEAGNYSIDAFCLISGTDERRWRVDSLDTRPINEGVSIISIIPTSTPQTNNVFVHLFEWKWTDIAAECTYLAEVGYSAVQVSPPQEHVVLDTIETDAWWTRYQPVSYILESRSGTEEEFEAMVSACNDVGVGIYVDVVINHMSGQNSPTQPGSAGTIYRHHQYPNLYDEDNFNYCGSDISNYQRRNEVQTCELVNLADLATDTVEVQETIRTYLQRLIDMGVVGFRIDAAKHMPASDITAILDRLDDEFYVFQEVIGAASEPVLPQEYIINGDVTEFDYSRQIGDSFNCGQISNLSNLTNGLLRSDDAVVFIDNHDNQRGHGAGGRCVLEHTDGEDVYNLGNIFMLAHPYGYPKVMSSYWWDDGSARADSNPAPTALVYSNGEVTGCNDTDWVCEHRREPIAAMVQFRQVTSGEALTDWEVISTNQIAFGRGASGFVALNNTNTILENHAFQTSMPAGDYCDVITGGLSEDGLSCLGAMITVDEDGKINDAIVPVIGAFAIHAESRLNDGG